MLKSLIEKLVKQLVDNPDKVVVTVVDQDDKHNVTIAVAQEDRGKVIGKEGQTVRALRTLATVARSRSGKEVVIDIAST